MKVLGLQLHSPHILDLPMVLVMLVVTIVLSVLAVRFFGWDVTQVSAVLFGGGGAVLANACGVDVRKHGLRGVIVTTLFSVVLVALAVAIQPLFR